MADFLTIFKTRKCALEEKCKFTYSKTLQNEITTQIQRKDKNGLEFATQAHNKYESIKSKIRRTKEPATEQELEKAMKHLDSLEAELSDWLHNYYYKLYPMLKPKQYGRHYGD